MDNSSSASGNGPAGGRPAISDICSALRTVIDPEIGLDIVSLGMIYAVETGKDDGKVTVRMTLTTPRCPLAPYIVEQAKKALNGVPGVKDGEVRLVWEPPWDASMMASDAVKRRFGIS